MRNLLIWIRGQNNWFWAAIIRSTAIDSKSLAVFRMMVGLYLLCINSPNFLWLSDVPQAFFEPPFFSIASFFGGFPGHLVLVLANVLLIILSAMLFLGVKARFSTITYTIIYIVCCSFQFSFGKIDHSPVLILALLVCMIFSDWGTYLALIPDKPRKVNQINMSLPLLSVFVCFGFFSAGFEKAIMWIDLDFTTNGSGAWFYKELHLRAYLLAPYIPKFMPFWGFKVMDYLGVIFELTPIFFLLHSRMAWKLWLIAACIFHFLNGVILNINFMNLFIVYVSFLDYSSWYNSLEHALKKQPWKIALVSTSIVLLCVRLINLFRGVPGGNIFFDYDQKENNLYLSVLIWIVAIFLLLKSILTGSKKKLEYNTKASLKI
ncbi:hypothetical protein [Dyadobacter sp. CY323]|uniref:hypothetical protein n=1 Tax=Dyadobacter sp. CY323 TaxID=2907302 RepID=UPI001F1B0FC6|nr:hypothetical protein [Dyadobacter sp. CY323]MCE6992754.1 hypothetical protein [Dyadobacter sp. CY323]